MLARLFLPLRILLVGAAFALGFCSDGWMARLAPETARGRLVELVHRLDDALAQGDAVAAHAMLTELRGELRDGDDARMSSALAHAARGDGAAARGFLEERLRDPATPPLRSTAIGALAMASRLLDRGETQRAIALCLPIWSEEKAPMELRMEAGLRMAQALRVERRFEAASRMQHKALGLPVPARTRLRLSRELGI